MKASAKLLMNQLGQMKKDPIEGIAVDLVDEDNVYEWDVFIAGPPDTVYQGGIFRCRLKFPQDYPYSPPVLTFKSSFWHPNVFQDGKVCISILHPPGNDPTSGERPEERWNPTQSPETILLSVISMIADPNISSPANVDASVEFRQDPEAFEKRVKKLIEKANKELPEDFEMPKPKKRHPEITFDMDEDVHDHDYELEEEEEPHEEEPHEDQPHESDHVDEKSENISELEEMIKMEQVKINLLEAGEAKKKKKKFDMEDTAEDHTDDEAVEETKEEAQITPQPEPEMIQEVIKEAPSVEIKETVKLYEEKPIEVKKIVQESLDKSDQQIPPNLTHALSKNPPPKNQCCLVM